MELFGAVGVLSAVDDSAEAEFAAFVARRHRALVRSAFLLLGDVHLAEDLVQTSLYRTWSRWPRLRSTGAAESYVRTTMVRLALRWRTRRWVNEVPTDVLPESFPAGPADGLAAGLDVWRALAGLPIEQRAVLVLRYFEDLSEADTAAVLRCPVGTVKSRSNRAMSTLRSSGLLAVDEATGGTT